MLMNEFLSPVERYYSDKLAEFGTRPQGVDWNGPEGQVKRFEQLCKVLPAEGSYSVADIGCGYGALLDFLSNNAKHFEYVGLDISATMIDAARELHAARPNAEFIVGTQPSRNVDFAIASGIFNVKLNAEDDAWNTYIVETLEAMNGYATRGFAFNCLTAYSDREKMRDNLHYADPCALFDLCKRRFARNVALLHDYDLYEFTIVVRK